MRFWYALLLALCLHANAEVGIPVTPEWIGIFTIRPGLQHVEMIWDGEYYDIYIKGDVRDDKFQSKVDAWTFKIMDGKRDAI